MTRIWTPTEAYEYAYRYGLKFPRDAKISDHFYWWEVFLHQENEAVPPLEIFYNAKKTADELEKYRTHSGKTINIHRWYSSPRYNKEVVYGNRIELIGEHIRGARSLHTLALAVDWHESGKTIEQSHADVLAMIHMKQLKMRIEKLDGIARVHTDCGHPYIPNGMIYDEF